MTDQSSPGRRKSFVEMLAPRSISSSNIPTSPPSVASAPSQPIPTHKKGMSITAMGLTGTSSGSSSPFDAFARQRRASISTSTASGSPEFRNSFDDNAVIEEDDFTKSPVNSPPSPSIGRRLSFGAQALRDVKQPGTFGGGGRRPSSSLFTLNESTDQDPESAKRSSGTGKATGEGFNWSEAMRDKTKRAPSMSGNPFTAALGRPRATSITTPEPPKEMPKVAPVSSPPLSRIKKPDHLGERMLRGDFMMD